MAWVVLTLWVQRGPPILCHLHPYRPIGVKLRPALADRASMADLPNYALILMALVAVCATVAILHVLACIARNETYVWTVRNRCDELRHQRQLDMLIQLQNQGLLGESGEGEEPKAETDEAVDGEAEEPIAEPAQAA